MQARVWLREPVLRALLLAGTAVLYLVGLDRNGWANSYYAAAAQSGAHSWTAFFFGSADLGNAITVDKPPAALWVMDLSVRVFGLSSWSLLVPQALMGVAAVGLLAAAVRRAVGPWPGLLAGFLLAVTPVATLMFRYDNPDALLTLLVVAAAWTTTRALDDGRLRWTVATGALLGAAFLAKSLQAFLVLPGLALVLLVAGRGGLRRRIGHLLAGGATLLVAAGWWVLAVALVPAGDRPFVGGSRTDNPLELAFGYNGLGRLAGERTPSGNELTTTGSVFRLLGSGGDQVGWLLPAAGIALVAGLVLVRGRPREDPARGALLLWGGWAVVTALVLSTMQGISHPYYSVELAPALAALVAVGGALLWRQGSRRSLATLAAGSAVTTAWTLSLVPRRLPAGDPVQLAVGALGLLGLGGLVLVAAGRTRARAAAAGLAVLAAALAPVVWSVATAGLPHGGSAVRAGPIGTGRAPVPARRPVSAAASRLLRHDRGSWTWAAALVGHDAADLQLELGRPVLPVGGFGGVDPAPTLAAFRADVDAHRIHWFVAGSRGHGEAAAITAWVAHSGAPELRCGATELYDLGALAGTGPPPAAVGGCRPVRPPVQS